MVQGLLVTVIERWKKLLYNWPALLNSFTDFLSSERNNKKEIRAKVTRILNKFKSYCFLRTIAAYLYVVQNITPLSLVFENNSLMAYKIVPAVEEAIAQLETLSKESAEGYLKRAFFTCLK